MVSVFNNDFEPVHMQAHSNNNNNKGRNMSLASRLMKTSKLDGVTMMSDVPPNATVNFAVKAMNIAFSGSIKSGFSSGMHTFAAPSKHFKTLFCMMGVAAYMQEFEDAVCLFYDSEDGASLDYFESMGVDVGRVIRKPIANIEELKFSIVKDLEEITRDDKVVIFIDSVGNLASKKEIDDALNDNAAADMTRAKQLKSFGRIVTPYLGKKDIPMFVINHTYDEIGMFPKTIMGGGQGIMLSSNSVFFISKRQVKEGKDLNGYQFVLIAEKSRFIREKSQIPITVLFDGGVDPYSGMLEIAIATGHVTTPKQGWYTRPSVKDDKNWRKKALNVAEFWDPIFADPTFDEAVQKMYKLGAGGGMFTQLIDEDGNLIDQETGEILNLDAED